MKNFTTVVKAMLVFDAAYLCFICAEDLCTRIQSRMKKKKKKYPDGTWKWQKEMQMWMKDIFSAEHYRHT